MSLSLEKNDLRLAISDLRLAISDLRLAISDLRFDFCSNRQSNRLSDFRRIRQSLIVNKKSLIQ